MFWSQCKNNILLFSAILQNWGTGIIFHGIPWLKNTRNFSWRYRGIPCEILQGISMLRGQNIWKLYGDFHRIPRVGFSLFVWFFTPYLRNRCTKVSKQVFHDESWKSIYFEVERSQGLYRFSDRMQYCCCSRRGFCTLVSAGFLWLLSVFVLLRVVIKHSVFETGLTD